MKQKHSRNDHFCASKQSRSSGGLDFSTRSRQRHCPISIGLIVAIIITSACSVAHAASVTWGAPTGISGGTDVSTSGVLFAAANNGGTGTTSQTVNGVTFNPFVTDGSSTTFTDTSGLLTLSVASGSVSGGSFFGSASAPFSNLSPSSYRALLTSASYSFSQLTLTINSLTIGQTYQVQLWANYSNIASPLGETLSAGGVTTLDYNVTDTGGGVGQFVIGTFTANSVSEQIQLTKDANTDFAQLNAVEVRTTAVPEPSTAASMLAGAALLAAFMRLRSYRSFRSMYCIPAAPTTDPMNTRHLNHSHSITSIPFSAGLIETRRQHTTLLFHFVVIVSLLSVSASASAQQVQLNWAGTASPNAAAAAGRPDDVFVTGAAGTSTFGAFGVGSGNTSAYSLSSLETLLSITPGGLAHGDFIAFEQNGTPSITFESGTWTFSDGFNSLSVTHTFGNTPGQDTPGVLALGNITLANYTTFFGLPASSGAGDIAYIVFNIAGVSAVNPQASTFGVTLVSPGGNVGTPDMDAMGTMAIPEPASSHLLLFMVPIAAGLCYTKRAAIRRLHSAASDG